MERNDEDSLANLSREEMMSALFANLVFQNTNMALMMLGRVPNPQTGEKLHDVDAARMFIDQLEMLQVKTRGNLTKEEEQLLQQSLTHVRLVFVEAVESLGQAQRSPDTKPGSQQHGAAAPAAPGAAADHPESAGTEESRKRFTRKY